MTAAPEVDEASAVERQRDARADLVALREVVMEGVENIFEAGIVRPLDPPGRGIERHFSVHVVLLMRAGLGADLFW